MRVAFIARVDLRCKDQKNVASLLLREGGRASERDRRDGGIESTLDDGARWAASTEVAIELVAQKLADAARLAHDCYSCQDRGWV